MLSRILSGVILSAGIIAVLVFTPPWALGVVVLVALCLSVSEYTKMARPDASAGERLAFLLACLAVVLWPVIAARWPFYTHGVGFLIAFMIVALTRLARPLPIETSLTRFGADAVGLLYLGCTFPFVFLLRGEGSGTGPHGGWVLLMVMAITFLSDTGGYFAGRFLGRHKLYPAISPKKTVEGLVGGIVLATAAAFAARAFFPGLGHLTVVDCVVLGVVGALFAVCGDLVESMMKRAYGVKDSGTLIPGHGGMLDRIDGLLFCGPFCWFYLGVAAG
ncbi:MAG: phosphatidate cytidylyltransferase [Myxococcales bacterium]|nr:phosphatidate cytidylyltransferase [Myxococcales bacterium]